MRLWETLRADAYPYSSRTGLAAMAEAYLRSPGFRLNDYRIRYGFDISPPAKTGPRFYIGHFGTVKVSAHTVLGRSASEDRGADRLRWLFEPRAGERKQGSCK